MRIEGGYLATHHAVVPLALIDISVVELLRSSPAPQTRFPRTSVHVTVLEMGGS